MVPSARETLSPALRSTVAMVLAGGQGERLAPLTRDRAKPAVPFGGIYRIIDFTLSNCVNSGIRRIHVLTQYKSYSLDRHIKQAWNLLQSELGEFVDVIPPQRRTGDSWYRGTADALYQNIYSLQMDEAEQVIVLGGDHVYKMDYSELLLRHLESRADVTVAATELPLAEACRMGVMAVDDSWRVERFQEKPAEPEPIPGVPERALVSMGIYVFSTKRLVEELDLDTSQSASQHDFGRDILPSMLARGLRVMAFPFRDRNSSDAPYWRDIGTLDSYYEANMDLVAVTPVLNLYDSTWPIRTYQPQGPPAKTVHVGPEREGLVQQSMMASGAIVSGARVTRSILGARVKVNSWAEVEDSVLFEDVQVGRNARLRRCIVDKGVVIPPDTSIGHDLERDRRRYTVSPGGVVVLAKGTRIELD